MIEGIGQRIKDIREENGLNQAEFGKMLKVSQAAIARWENEKREPTASALLTIAQTFNIELEYLFGLKSYETIK